MSFNVRKHIIILLLKSENPGDPTEKYIVKTLLFFLSGFSFKYIHHSQDTRGEGGYLFKGGLSAQMA